MRIVSKFRDYYDSVMGHGQDFSTVFIRSHEYVEQKTPLWELLRVRDPHDQGVYFREYRLPETAGGKREILCTETFRVYFCGKIYRGLKLGIKESHYYSHYNREFFCYTFEDLVGITQSLGILVEDICRGNFSSNTVHAVTNLKKYLAAQGTDENSSELVKHRVIIAKHVPEHWTPVGKRQAGCWELNGSLAEIKFFKLVDPFTAYQELDMYISGVLGQQTKEVANISDKDRIYQHGFDKYSFRKLPEERKRKS